MLRNAYFLAKIGADIAENEQHVADSLPKICQPPYGTVKHVTFQHLAAEATRPLRQLLETEEECVDGVHRIWSAVAKVRGGGLLGFRVSKIGKISKFCKFLAGSFSAVSKRNFARKYAFDSILQALQDVHPFAPLQSQNFRKKSV